MSEPYYSDDEVTVHHGDALDVLAGMPDASVDAVVTDPPYGLEFMGREWDKFRTDDPGTNRHRGERAGAHGTLVADVDESLPSRPSGVLFDPAKRQARGVSYGGGKRPTTNRCAGCGKRDQFRNPHACPDGTPWQSELIDPHSAPPTSLAYQQWCERWAAECLRLLKPGGHLLAFGGTRTYHRLACAVEDAGFEIRDTISWLYGSGFPKSLNVGDGRGTALKPAHEPIVVARKPLAGTVAANVQAHGTGALNIDGCRVDGGERPYRSRRHNPALDETRSAYGAGINGSQADGVTAAGRWPANVVLDEDAAAELNRQSGTSVSSDRPRHNTAEAHNRTASMGKSSGDWTTNGFADSGGASRFYYTAKAAPDERPHVNGVAHPTVKPLELMRWLVRLVTPPGGLVLDPFAGSGTTGEACLIEGFRCVLIENYEDYLPLIEARLSKPLQPVLEVSDASP